MHLINLFICMKKPLEKFRYQRTSISVQLFVHVLTSGLCCRAYMTVFSIVVLWVGKWTFCPSRGGKC